MGTGALKRGDSFGSEDGLSLEETEREWRISALVHMERLRARREAATLVIQVSMSAGRVAVAMCHASDARHRSTAAEILAPLFLPCTVSAFA